MNKQKTMVTSAARPTRLHSLDSLLAEIALRRLILVADESCRVEIWSPQCKLPISLHRAFFKHNAMLYRLMSRCDKAVCPSRDLHSRHWRTNTGVCRVCVRLDKSLVVSESRRDAA